MKKLLPIVLAVLLAFTMFGCSGQEEAKPTKVDKTAPAFSITVGEATVTNETMANYDVWEMTSKSVNSHGTETEATYTGYLLSDVFAAANFSDLSTCTATATADDGYSIDLTAETVNADTTLLAFAKDGENFEAGPWIAPCASETSGDYLKNTAAIDIDGAAIKTPSKEEGATDVLLPELKDKTDKVTFADYSFLVNGKEITNSDLEGLKIYKATVSVTNKKGEASEVTYTGYRLSDVLEKCGVTANEVTAVANDGYESTLDPETAASEYTLLAIEKDKETGEDGTVWVAPCESKNAGDYCKLVTEIKA